MKQKTFKKRLIAILLTMLITTVLPITVMADEDYNSYSDDSSDSYEESSQKTGITSEDWAELQSEAEAELSSQNAEQSKNSASSDKSNSNQGDSFKDFKEGKYVGSGEWLLVIGIILIVLGIAGIGFIVFMMIHRKKLLQAMAMHNRRKKYPAGTPRTSNQNNGNSSGRRIAPKNNRDK